MQIDGEHRRQPSLPVFHARSPFLRFPASPLPHFQNLRPSRPLAITRAVRVGSLVRIGAMAGQHWGPATRSAFFRSDIGGETQGIQRFQSLEGVE